MEFMLVEKIDEKWDNFYVYFVYLKKIIKIGD